jgi:hypothetical protein
VYIRVCTPICEIFSMTYATAVYTVKNSWWWTEELYEKCTVSFQVLIWEIRASSWYYSKKFSTMHGHMNVKKYNTSYCCYMTSSLIVIYRFLFTENNSCLEHSVRTNYRKHNSHRTLQTAAKYESSTLGHVDLWHT